MPSNITSAIVFIVNAITSLYLLVLLLRFWLPWLQADFRNPLAQGILRLTSPVVIPVRRIVPSFGRLDTATILVSFVFQYLTILLLLLIIGQAADFVTIAITTIVKLVVLSINLFVYAIFIRVILSWISPGAYNPATAIITSLTDPVLRPFRRLLPPMGGFDLSPILAIILLLAATIVVNGFKPFRSVTAAIDSSVRRTTETCRVADEWFIVEERESDPMPIARTLVCLSVLLLAAACGGPDPSADVPDAQPAGASDADIGMHVVHFSAQTTDQLPREIAQAYQIQRSPERAMLNISVLRKSDNTPVTADISVRTRNLTQQLKNVELRPITEQDAIYYIGETKVANRETLIFELSVRPEGVDRTSQIRFQRQFYTD